MTYRSTKKIYPGNYAEPLNGWYQNVATGAKTVQGRTGSAGGPTAVLACPGWRYFQFGAMCLSPTFRWHWPSQPVPGDRSFPYKNDPTRVNITGMVVSGNNVPTNNISVGRGPAYIYCAAISVPTGWDNTVASGIANTDPVFSVLAFGLANGGTATTLGQPTDPNAAPAEDNDTPCSQANIQFDTTSIVGQVPAGTEAPTPSAGHHW